jgi:hypothetical protein
MKLLLVIYLCREHPPRGLNFSTGVVMRADLLFRGCIGGGSGNLRGRCRIVEN